MQSMRLSCVIISPFKVEFFQNETFVSYFNLAKHWIMKKRNFLEKRSVKIENGTCFGMGILIGLQSVVGDTFLPFEPTTGL